MKLRRKLGTARQLGVWGTTLHLFTPFVQFLWTREDLVIFRMLPHQLSAVEPDLAGTRWEAHSVESVEFLARYVDRAPAALLTELSSAARGQRVHWIEVDGEIASWGFSTQSNGAWPLTETRSRLVVPSGAVCLTSFETLRRLRGRRLYPSILTQILRQRFEAGCACAYIWCRERNVASYRAIKRVGFEEFANHRYTRVIGLSSRIVRSLSPSEE